MKIEYRKGNVFATDIKTIVHGCNAKGVMGSGVAKIVKEQHNKAYQEYMRVGRDYGLMLGDIISVESNNKTIINAITQQNYGRQPIRYVSYDAIASVMQKINSMNIDEIAMPQIGAGLANGCWEVIAAIIEDELTMVRPVVYML